MKRKIKWVSILILIPLYFSSITHGNGYYYTNVGEVSYIDDKNDILQDSIHVGIPEDSCVKNSYCNYDSGSELNAINKVCYNDENHFAEYNYSLNVTHKEKLQHTGYFYERSRMKRFASILIFFGLNK